MEEVLTRDQLTIGKIVRQGDVFLEVIEAIPSEATPVDSKGDVILALGEVTGHAHRFKAGSVTAFRNPLDKLLGQQYIVTGDAPAKLLHEEHGAKVFPPNMNFRVWIHREYHPEEIRNVAD